MQHSEIATSVGAALQDEAWVSQAVGCCSLAWRCVLHFYMLWDEDGQRELQGASVSAVKVPHTFPPVPLPCPHPPSPPSLFLSFSLRPHGGLPLTLPILSRSLSRSSQAEAPCSREREREGEGRGERGDGGGRGMIKLLECLLVDGGYTWRDIGEQGMHAGLLWRLR